MESVAESGATSVVATCQRVEEPCGIHRRKWSRVIAIIVVCQGVMEPCEIHRRKWSSVVAVTTACQRVMEPRRICCRKWSRVVAVTAACQGVQVCRSKFDWSSISIEARMGIIYRGVSAKAYLQQKFERNSSMMEAWVKAYGGNLARTARGRNLK